MSIKHLSGSGLYTGSKSIKLWDQTTVQNDFQSIATVVVPSGGQSSVVFSNIPQSFTHLRLHVLYRDTSSSSGESALWMQFNGDTGSTNDYAWHRLYGTGAGNAASAQSGSATTWGLVGIGSYGGDIANEFGVSLIEILDYTSTTKAKVVKSLTGHDANGSGYAGVHSIIWTPATQAAITQITLFPTSGQNFAQYSHVALYGIKVAS